MHLFKFLPVFLPAAAFAFPDAQPHPEALQGRSPLPDPVTYELVARDLIARQIDVSNLTSELTGFLSNLGPTFSALESLLSASTIDNIENLLTNAANLLADPFVNDTRQLIFTAVAALDSPLVTDLEGLFTPDTITEIGDLIHALSGLLSSSFINSVVTLIEDVAPVSLS